MNSEDLKDSAISGVTQASERTTRWRESLSTRLSGEPREQLPQQVAIPHDERSASQEPPTTKPRG